MTEWKIKPSKIAMINKIVELTNKDTFRPEIAKEVGVSEATVYKYQKKFDLV